MRFSIGVMLSQMHSGIGLWQCGQSGYRLGNGGARLRLGLF